MDYALLIGLLSIAVAIFFGLRGIPSALRRIERHTEKIGNIVTSVTKIEERTEKMESIATKIEERTRRINDIVELVTRLDERLRHRPQETTAELSLKNIGKVWVSAQPTEEHTYYNIKTEKRILKGGFISKKRKETSLRRKEEELFGREVVIVDCTPTEIILRVPSTDPKTCVEYIAFFLKWLDSEYWESLKELEEYEKITL